MPGETMPQVGEQTAHARYATREEQLAELVDHMRRRDRRLARALVAALSADARTLDAFGTLLSFVARQSRTGP